MITAAGERLLSVCLGLLDRPELVFSDLMVASGYPLMMKTPEGWVGAPCPGYSHFSFTDVIDLASASLNETGNRSDTKWSSIKSLFDLNGEALWSVPVGDGLSLHRVKFYLQKCSETNGANLQINRKILNNPNLGESTGLDPSIFYPILNHSSGLILIGGPVGAGKTTTLAALVTSLNATRPYYVISVGMSHEFVDCRGAGISVHRIVGRDVEKYCVAIQSAVLSGADVLVLDNIPDRDVLDHAVSAANGGLLVIAAIRAHLVAGMITKIQSWYSDAEIGPRMSVLSESLLAIVAQERVPLADGTGWRVCMEYLEGGSEDLNISSKMKSLFTTRDASGVPSFIRSRKQLPMVEILASLYRQKQITETAGLRCVGAGSHREFLRLAAQP